MDGEKLSRRVYKMSESFLDELIELENLSEQISLSVNNNDFEKILELDKQRQVIIKTIKNYNSKEFKNRLDTIYNNNLKDIKSTEIKLQKFTNNKNKSLKIFSAYSNN